MPVAVPNSWSPPPQAEPHTSLTTIDCEVYPGTAVLHQLHRSCVRGRNWLQSSKLPSCPRRLRFDQRMLYGWAPPFDVSAGLGTKSMLHAVSSCHHRCKLLMTVNPSRKTWQTPHSLRSSVPSFSIPTKIDGSFIEAFSWTRTIENTSMNMRDQELYAG